MADYVQVDTDPWVIQQGATVTVGWMVDVDGVPIDAPWLARGQIRATVDAPTVLETFTPTISGGVVSFTFDSVSTAAMTWTTGVIGVEVYDTSTPPRVYRVAQAPISVSPELVR